MRLTKHLIAVMIVLLFSSFASANAVDDWLAGLKSKYDGTELVFAMTSHPGTDGIQALVPEFTEKTGIKITFDIMGEGQLIDKTLLECQSADLKWDVIMIAAETSPQMLHDNCTVPLNDYLNDQTLAPSEPFGMDDYVPAYLSLFKMDDQIVALPFAGETVFLTYRKDLYEEAGLSVPKTWDEFLSNAQQLKTDDVAAVVMRIGRGWEFTYMWSIFIYPFGGDMVDLDSNTAQINNAGNAASLEYLRKLLPYGPVGFENYHWDTSMTAIMEGKAAMSVEASALAGEYENPDKSRTAGKLGYAPLPSGPAGAFSGVWGWGLGVKKTSQNQEAAIAAIAYFTSEAKHQEYVNAGGPVSRTHVLANPDNQAKHPYYQATLDTLDQAAALYAMGKSAVPKTAKWFQISDVMGVYGSEAFVGERTIEDALSEMNDQVQKILNE